MLNDLQFDLNDLDALSPADVAWTVGAVLLIVTAVATLTVVGARRRRAHQPGRGWSGTRTLIGVAVATAVGVAVLGGVRSFEAVSQRFGSPLVPLTADGMIIACTALRLAALTRGWRLPGSLVTTYGFIGGTVWLNVAAAHGWTDAVAHALAPVSYAVLVEMLAHLLRLHLRLAQPAQPRLAGLTWVTSPVVTTRVWLHLARTGRDDPVAARALVQQVVRMGSRLQVVCPSRWWWPLDRARSARSAALQTIRDGLLSAANLAALLPSAGTRLDPGALLALVDGAALACTEVGSSAPVPVLRGAPVPVLEGAPEGALPGAPAPVLPARSAGALGTTGPPALLPDAPSPARSGDAAVGDERTDAELIAELHRHGGPLSQREVKRLLRVGTPKAKRLIELAGRTPPATTGHPGAETNGHAASKARQLQSVTDTVSDAHTNGSAKADIFEDLDARNA